MYQIWRIYLDLWGYDCKKCVWLTFGCKLRQSNPIVTQLKLDLSCHPLNVYTKFQIDISKHVEEKSRKSGWKDGRTDGHCHGIIRLFFKQAYKNEYELLILRALTFSYVHEIHIFQCMGKIFCVAFPLKFHTSSYPYIERCNFYTMLKI